MQGEPGPESITHETMTTAVSGLMTLAGIQLDHSDPVEILRAAGGAISALSPCHVEATYRCVDGAMLNCPTSSEIGPDIEQLVAEYGLDTPLTLGNGRWASAISLRYQDTNHGCFVVSNAEQPADINVLLLNVLARQTGAALAYAAVHIRDEQNAQQLNEVNGRLEETNGELSATVARLTQRTAVHETLNAAMTAGIGDQGIVDALHQLTSLPVTLEDPFGNIRCVAGGPTRPPVRKQSPERRQQLLTMLAGRGGAVRVRGRVMTLVKPRADVLGLLVLDDEADAMTDDDLFALQYGATVLALELSHQRNVAELELTLRRELVDDLVTGEGSDAGSAYARAEALGHDLRRPHYAVVVQRIRRDGDGLAGAVSAAATAMNLDCLQGRRQDVVVLLCADRPDSELLHRSISEQLGTTAIGVGIGSRCNDPAALPKSLSETLRALRIRLLSATPEGVSAYDELGFYRLIDAAQSSAAEDFMLEWLGPLIDYDKRRHTDLVQTLSTYLECGGNYDDAAAALHIHRSTLRYRLTRIRELTAVDMRDVNCRFNLHAATRAWRFLHPTAGLG